MLHSVAERCRAFNRISSSVAEYFSVLQYVIVTCSLLQSVAVSRLKHISSGTNNLGCPFGLILRICLFVKSEISDKIMDYRLNLHAELQSDSELQCVAVYSSVL